MAVVIWTNNQAAFWKVYARRWSDGTLVHRDLIDNGSLALERARAPQSRAAVLRATGLALLQAADTLEREDPSDTRL